MYLAIDANFKLSCKERGIQDIELMPGWGPYVEEKNYQLHLETHKENPEEYVQLQVIYKKVNNTATLTIFYFQHLQVLFFHGLWLLMILDHTFQELAEHVVKRLKQHGLAVIIFVLAHVRWVQLLVMRPLFLRQFNEAITMSQKHDEIFKKFNATFSTAMTDKWECQIKAWNENHIGSNPYHETEHTNRLQDVRLALTNEEAEAVEKGTLPKHKITLTKFILLAFELEEQQQILKLEVSEMKKNPTAKKQADLQNKISMNLQKSPEIQNAANSEFKLCKAQAEDALANIRHLHRVISTLWIFKQLNTSGDFKIRLIFVQSNLHELKNEDIRGPGKESDDTTSNGQFEMSWIWLVPHTSANTENNNNELDESLRIEWAKCHARKDRWAEEVLILKEEMRKVIQYLEWKAEWWTGITDVRNYDSSIGNDIKQGVKAYAMKQASICQRLAQHCANWWIPAFQKQKYMPDWILKYVQQITTVPLDKSYWQDLEEEDDMDEQDEEEGAIEDQNEEEYMENLMDIL
ncbi:hypothetical protein BDQ17DRAFT_1328384 [Cyathus striatus]|nr:hypothetical protein BDQ17DRAFT_1328384 [Cyathus striatus]